MTAYLIPDVSCDWCGQIASCGDPCTPSEFRAELRYRGWSRRKFTPELLASLVPARRLDFSPVGEGGMGDLCSRCTKVAS